MALRMCSRVYARVMRERKLPFSIMLSLYGSHTLYTCRFFIIFACGTLFCFKYAQVMWRYKERPIRMLKEDRQSSLKLGGMRRNLIHRQIVFKII